MRKTVLAVFFLVVLLMQVYAAPEVKPDGNKPLTPSLSSPKTNIKNDSSLHPAATRESWYISGLVENDSGFHYGYYFVVIREANQFNVFANVMDLKTGKVLFSEQEHAIIDVGNRLGINLKMKNAFLRYNDINDSWVFGLDQSPGFNLRLESLAHEDYTIRHLDGVSFYSLQSKRVNGQLTIADKNEFVTAKNAWLTHEWSDKVSQDLLIQRLMCRFYDGKGLILMRGYKANKVTFDLATLLEPNGENAPVSQFSVVSQSNPSLWEVSLLSPKMKFKIETPKSQSLAQKNETAYFYSGLVKTPNQKIEGYCLISKDKMGAGIKEAYKKLKTTHKTAHLS